uniref:Uncharacterized protein n=1 Tax=Romanomermis culicivorax TaxID=13658 RepID=A0A915JLD8_ROMCU
MSLLQMKSLLLPFPDSSSSSSTDKSRTNLYLSKMLAGCPEGRAAILLLFLDEAAIAEEAVLLDSLFVVKTKTSMLAILFEGEFGRYFSHFRGHWDERM